MTINIEEFFGDKYSEYEQASADAKSENLKKLTESEKTEILGLVKANPAGAKTVYKGFDAYLVQAPVSNMIRRELSNGSISISLIHKSAIWVSCMFIDSKVAEPITEGLYYIIFGKFRENEKNGVVYKNFTVHDVINI